MNHLCKDSQQAINLLPPSKWHYSVVAAICVMLAACTSPETTNDQSLVEQALTLPTNEMAEIMQELEISLVQQNELTCIPDAKQSGMICTNNAYGFSLHVPEVFTQSRYWTPGDSKYKSPNLLLSFKNGTKIMIAPKIQNEQCVTDTARLAVNMNVPPAIAINADHRLVNVLEFTSGDTHNNYATGCVAGLYFCSAFDQKQISICTMRAENQLSFDELTTLLSSFRWEGVDAKVQEDLFNNVSSEIIEAAGGYEEAVKRAETK